MPQTPSFVLELDREIAQLEGELAALHRVRARVANGGWRVQGAAGERHPLTVEDLAAPLMRPRKSKAKAKAKVNRRPGSREAAIIDALAKAPDDGLTIPELAEALGIQPNYLYRAMPRMLDQSKVAASVDGVNVYRSEGLEGARNPRWFPSPTVAMTRYELNSEDAKSA